MNYSFRKITFVLLGALCGAGFLYILFLAYSSNIPSFISAVPFYDKVGHFFLFGIVGYALHLATGRISVGVFPIALSLFAVFTFGEEVAQMFSDVRTFSLVDLLFSLAGILVFYLLDKLWLRNVELV